VPHLQRIINARHFAELQAHECICPQGEKRADLRAAYIAMQLVRYLASGQGTVSMSEFIYEPADLLAFHDEDDEREEGEPEPEGRIPARDQRIMNTMNQIMHTQNARNAELKRRQGKT